MTSERVSLGYQEIMFATIWGASGILFVVSLVTSVAIYSLTAKEICPTDAVTVCYEDTRRCPVETNCFCPAPYPGYNQEVNLDDWRFCRSSDFHLPHTAEVCYWTTRVLTFIALITLFMLFVYGRFVQFTYNV